MRKKILLLLVLILAILFTSCKDTPVGYYTIKKITAGEVTMTSKDSNAIGIQMGSLKLQKSGKCKLVILEESQEGTWTESNGKIVLKFEDDEYTCTYKNGKISMKHDADGVEYILKR